MARAKLKMPPKPLNIKKEHTKCPKNDKEKPILLELKIKRTTSVKSATNPDSDLMIFLLRISNSQSPILSAAEFVHASHKHKTPILSLLKSVSCSRDKIHKIALKIPEIMLSNKERSDKEISSKLVRDKDGVLKWALLSPQFNVDQRLHALQVLCSYLKKSNPKKKSLRIWTDHFFNEDRIATGFRLDSILAFGKSLPPDFASSTNVKLLKNLVAMNEMGFARLLASETKICLLDHWKQELSLKTQPLRIPADVEIIIVDNNDTALAAENALLSSPVVGVDTETQPQFKKGDKQNPVSIVQIATLSEVFIFDLLKASRICGPVLSKILQCSSIVKLGLGIRDDLVQLSSTYPGQDFGFAVAVVDLNDIFKYRYPETTIKSLARLTLFCTGRNLQKTQQTSNWARRPLSDAQKHYASLDAFVCLQIASNLSNCELTIEAISEVCMSFGKDWTYSISDDPGCMWVRPW